MAAMLAATLSWWQRRVNLMVKVNWASCNWTQWHTDLCNKQPFWEYTGPDVRAIIIGTQRMGVNFPSSIVLYRMQQSRAIRRLVDWLNYRFMSNSTQNRSQATINVYSKFPEILNGHVVFEICKRTGRHTHIFITILCIPIRGKVIKNQQATGRLQYNTTKPPVSFSSRWFDQKFTYSLRMVFIDNF